IERGEQVWAGLPGREGNRSGSGQEGRVAATTGGGITCTSVGDDADLEAICSISSHENDSQRTIALHASTRIPGRFLQNIGSATRSETPAARSQTRTSTWPTASGPMPAPVRR